MTQRRIETYDPSAGMFCAPTSYSYIPIEIVYEPPSDDWVRKSLQTFVRGEFGTVSDRTLPLAGLPDMKDEMATGDEPYLYLEDRERELVYGPYLENLLQDLPSDLVVRVHAILSNEQIGNKRNNKNVDIDAFRKMIEPSLTAHHRIRFVMPGFPFKDQNPFRTESPPETVDLGELALLIRLHVLALALYQVHPEGVDWVLISDGATYAPIFGIDTTSTQLYKRSLLTWRNQLNIGSTVSIVDLQDLIRRVNGARGTGGNGCFDSVRNSIRGSLRALLQCEDLSVTELMAVLRRGMVWNLDLRRYWGRVSPAELWGIAKSLQGGSLSAEAAAVAREVQERSSAAALEYASCNLALKYLNVFSLLLPNTARATIHAKAGEVAVPSLGRCFPWNGVPTLAASMHMRTLEVMPLFDAAERSSTLTRFRAPGISGAFFYTFP